MGGNHARGSGAAGARLVHLPTTATPRLPAGCGVIVHQSEGLGLVLVDRNTGGSTCNTHV